MQVLIHFVIYLDCLKISLSKKQIIYEALNHVTITPFLSGTDLIFFRLNLSWREN